MDSLVLYAASQTSTVSDLITASTSVALVFLACWAGWEARKAAKAAWVSLGKQAEREEAEQASKIYTLPVDYRMNIARLNEPSVRLTNGSDLPVYEVSVVIEEMNSGAIYERSLPSLMPGATTVVSVLPSTLVNKWGWQERVTEYGEREYTLPTDQDTLDFETRIGFRDAAGQRWQRDRLGVLAKQGC
ncbi:hypothetical protein [Dietzia maris]|uniref:hypothetical protein n=1 Tax=Dietzia maris TaxID=37915 RepID=UPI0037CBCC4D